MLDDKQLLLVSEVAAMMRVTDVTVMKWINAGLLEYIRVAGTIRIIYPQKALLPRKEI